MSLFLSNRKISVKLAEHRSEPSYVSFGLPHGSILEPLLFTLFMNDLDVNIITDPQYIID